MNASSFSMKRKMLMVRVAKNAWSNEAVRQLRRMAEAGEPLDAIASALRRTPTAVRNKAGMHGVSLKGLRQAQKSEEEVGEAS